MSTDAEGLLGIGLGSDSEDESTTTTTTTTITTTNSNTQECAQPIIKADRTALSEEAFQELKRTYRVKVENGEFHLHLSFPIGSTSPDGSRTINKPEAQEILHAVEELYFFRRYEEAVALIQKIWADAGENLFDKDTTGLLRLYERRCAERLKGKGE
ncbi:hypothetical protein QBC32DRAFT_329412 [Pseudoneurospora amorphoporcata]|uniref:Uncharacterized protein n=1 Tax=Pseudoneurospora amorphoporcata TaxID=241081 RepID=A0AAN6P7B1_9PEZI|nr:hypothetical protein QBC32DRAFT_329412 [Pseudoneurospora amorphoporcata]